MGEQQSLKQSVLIVEDEYDNREILRAVVEDLLGYDAILASDGLSAVEMAAEHKPCLILMDLMMPVLDGFEAMRRIKENPDTKDIPVVAVTALSRPADRQRALSDGAVDYLSKPFDLEALVAMVNRYMSARGEATS